MTTFNEPAPRVSSGRRSRGEPSVRPAVVAVETLEARELLASAVTVVAQDPRAIGTRAAELLFERLAGYDGPAREIVLPVVLIARGSGELPPPGAGG